MFRGVTHLTVDPKGRMAFPTRYRDALAHLCQGRLVVTVDPAHCLLIYPLPEWEDIERRLVKLPTLNSQVRRLQRLLIGHATECELDGSGRILLPPPLREFAGLDKQVVLLGQLNKFELWDQARWAEKREEWLAEDAGPLELPDELGQISL